MTKITTILFFLIALKLFSQNEINIEAKLLENGKKIVVSEKITVKNTNDKALTEIVLNDWNHAFSSKKSPLAKKFSDEFIRNYHLSLKSEHGETKIIEVKNTNYNLISYSRAA